MKIPKDILAIHKAFKRAGYKLYVVGGAVRDHVLGKTPKDFDLASDAKPEDVLKIAERNGFHTTEVGKAFGVVVINGHEVAAFRKDVYMNNTYEDFIKFLRYINVDEKKINDFINKMK